MLNVIDAQDDLKMMSDQQLLRKAQEGDPRYPQYLIVAEKQNRDRMRKEVAGREASDQTVAEQIMYGGIQSQRPPQMAMMPPQMPAMPPQAPMMPPQMAQAPQPPMQMMSDGGVVKASSGLYTASPSAAQRLNPPTYPLLQVAPDAIYSQLETGEMIELPGPTMTRQQRIDKVIEKIGRGEMSADQVRDLLQNYSRRTGVTTPLEQQTLGYFDAQMLEQSREATAPDSSELKFIDPNKYPYFMREEDAIKEPFVPMPPFGRMLSLGSNLATIGARNLATRFGGKELAEKIFGPIPLQSSDVARSGILSGTQALSSLIEGDSDAVGPLEAVSFGSPQYVPAKQNVLDYINERSEDPLGFEKLQAFFDASSPQVQGNTDVSVQGKGSGITSPRSVRDIRRRGPQTGFEVSPVVASNDGEVGTTSPRSVRDIRRRGPQRGNKDVTPDNKGSVAVGGSKPNLIDQFIEENDPDRVVRDAIEEGQGNQGNGGGGSKGLLSLGDYESIFTKLMDATDKSEFKETPKVDFSGIRDDARGMGIATILGSIGAGIAGGNLSQGLRDATGAVDRLGKRLSDIGMAEKMSDQKATITDITRRESRLDKIRGYSLQIQKLLLDAESADASLASRALSSIPMVMRELTASLQNVNLTDDQRNAIAEDLITYNNQFRNLSSRVTNNYPGFGIVTE